MPRRSKSEELLEFEIRFYERLLASYPTFIDVLVPLGDAYTRRGHFEQGLAIDLKLIELRGSDPLMWYNLACSYSLLKRVDDSLHALCRSLQLGYDDLKYLQRDPDLLNLRHSPKYRQLMDTLLRKSPSATHAPAPPQPPASGPADPLAP